MTLQASRAPPNASLRNPLDRQASLMGEIIAVEVSKISEKKVGVPGDLGKKERYSS